MCWSLGLEEKRAMPLIIDVTSDVVCPWCYIGKRRLEKALAVGGHTNAIVRWHPFQLNPQIPKEGIDRQQYRIAKFGSLERSRALEAQVIQAARGDGLTFALDKIARTPNTLDAHRLIRLAGQEGIQDAVMEALFRAYFTEGKNIGDPSSLLAIVTQAGLDRAKAEALLAGSEDLPAIAAEEEKAHRAGVQGVPYFVINKQLSLSGARDPGTFLAAFEQAGTDALPEETSGFCKTDPSKAPSC